MAGHEHSPKGERRRAGPTRPAPRRSGGRQLRACEKRVSDGEGVRLQQTKAVTISLPSIAIVVGGEDEPLTVRPERPNRLPAWAACGARRRFVRGSPDNSGSPGTARGADAPNALRRDRRSTGPSAHVRWGSAAPARWPGGG